MKSVLVSATVVTHNSGLFIGRCLDAVFRQECESLELLYSITRCKNDLATPIGL